MGAPKVNYSMCSTPRRQSLQEVSRGFGLVAGPWVPDNEKNAPPKWLILALGGDVIGPLRPTLPVVGAPDVNTSRRTKSV
jgi:hypothetical protein